MKPLTFHSDVGSYKEEFYFIYVNFKSADCGREWHRSAVKWVLTVWHILAVKSVLTVILCVPFKAIQPNDGFTLLLNYKLIIKSEHLFSSFYVFFFSFWKMGADLNNKWIYYGQAKLHQICCWTWESMFADSHISLLFH